MLNYLSLWQNTRHKQLKRGKDFHILRFQFKISLIHCSLVCKAKDQVCRKQKCFIPWQQIQVFIQRHFQSLKLAISLLWVHKTSSLHLCVRFLSLWYNRGKVCIHLMLSVCCHLTHYWACGETVSESPWQSTIMHLLVVIKNQKRGGKGAKTQCLCHWLPMLKSSRKLSIQTWFPMYSTPNTKHMCSMT